ncbi:MAG: phosphoesterase [Rhodothermales bacterium]
MEDAVTFADHLAAARATFRAWLSARDRTARLVVFCHFDADGLAAGALFGRGLARLGFEDVHVVPSGRFENAFFSDSAKDRLRALDAAALVVTDLGVNAAGVLPEAPTLYVDHHRPEGEPAGAVITGYAWDPIPCSAWLAFDLLDAETDSLPRSGGVDDLLWIAAIGVLSDLGDNAPWPRLAEAKKRYTAKWLKEAVVLTNAARRASTFDPETPLHLLMTGDGPKALSEGPGSERLAVYRKEVNAEMAEARKAAPVFSETEPFALVRLDSACQVHPLIAQQWRGRLPKYAVIAANTGYRPGLVAFSTRTARADLILPEIFQSVDVGDAYADDFGHGHDAASGGHLPPPVFNDLLDALGFPAVAHVPESDG